MKLITSRRQIITINAQAIMYKTLFIFLVPLFMFYVLMQ